MVTITFQCPLCGREVEFSLRELKGLETVPLCERDRMPMVSVQANARGLPSSRRGKRE